MSEFNRLVFVIALVGSVLAGVVFAAPIAPTSSEQTALDALSSRLQDARLLWVNEDRIFYMTMGDPSPQLISPDGATETNPRWSPDGTKILFVREPSGVFIMDADFSNATRVIPGGTDASWTRDGRSITAVVGGGYLVTKYDLDSGQTNTIYDSRQAPYNGQQVSQAAELRIGGRFLLTFRTTPEHTTEIVDLQQKVYIANSMMQRGDCSPAWAPDGSYIMQTARTSNRPVLRTDFDDNGPSVSDSVHFIGVENTCECSHFYIHGQRVSNDGQWVAFGAKIFDGPKANGTREIWLWKIGESQESAVRVTFDSGEDHSPSLFIPSGDVQDGGAVDAGEDGSAVDAGEDGSAVDAGEDGSAVDAGEDGSVVDAGEDGSVVDAGEDGSAVDAGEDGSAVDAGEDGSAVDAGDKEKLELVGGCGCGYRHAKTDLVSLGFLFFLLLYLAKHKRKHES